MATKITTGVLADNAVTDAKITQMITLTTATQAAADNTTKSQLQLMSQRLLLT